MFWVVAPASPSWKRLYTGEQELERFLSGLKGQHRVINLLMDKDFNTEDFVDPSHLNLQGATKFSQLLKKRIENL